MFIPRLPRQRLNRKDVRSSGKSVKRLCVLGLLCLLGATQAGATNTYEPGIALTASLDDLRVNNDGTYTIRTILTVKNVGNEDLVRLQLKDKLDFIDPERIVEVSRPQVLKGNLTVNPDYNGLSDHHLLQGEDELAIGSTARLVFEFRMRPGDDLGPYVNKAMAWSEGRHSGKAADDQISRKFSLPIEPTAQFEKTVGEARSNGDGSYTARITLETLNVGVEDFVRVQMKDSLDIFDGGRLIGVDDFEVLAGELTLNPNYDGIGDIRLLTGHNTIVRGARASLRFAVTFEPGVEDGPFKNCAMLWLAGRDSGIGRDYHDCANIHVPLEPRINVHKQAGEVVVNGDGSLSVPMTITVSNTGNEALLELQLEDDLDIFASGELLAVESLASDTLSLNPEYDGLVNVELLTATDALPLAGSGTLTFVLRFAPGEEPGPFLNTAIGRGTGASTGEVVSDSGSAPFLARVTEQQAAIEVQKQAGEVVANGDGSLSVPMTITVNNTGNEALLELQLEDDLDIFASGELLAVESLASDTLSLNPGYDGVADVELLTATDALPLAGSGALTFVLRFAPGEEPGPFLNTAIGRGTGATTGEVVSDSGSAPFLARVTEQQAAIEVQKQAGEVVANGDGSLSVPMTITVSNTGNEELLELQLEDDLDIFASGELLAVESLASDTLSLNPGYDGVADVELLTATDALPLAGSGTLTFVLRFAPGGEPGPFLNTVIGRGTGATTGEVVSDSDAAPFLAQVTQQQAAIEVQKQAGEVIANGDGSLSVPMTITVSNTGNEELLELQLEDDLDIFASGELLAVESLASDTLSLNPAYDGLTEVDLLTATDALPLAGSGTLTFVLRFAPGGEPGPFLNTVIGRGTGATTGEVVSDSDAAPFDPVGTGPLGAAIVSVSKRADKKDVVRGDVVGYEITVTNLTANPIFGVVVTDEPPAGFRFVETSAYLIRAGSDGSLNTGDDVVSPLGASGTRPAVFDVFDLGPDERILVRYLMRVSVGVADGQYINNVTVTTPQRMPTDSSAPVNVVGDPIFEKTTIIGKVFYDRDPNNRHYEDELGIAGVRLVTVGGLIIETDAQGRYHLADVDVARFERGANFIIKLDESSLPEGATVTSGNPRVIRLTQGTMSRINFVVDRPEVMMPDCFESCLVDNQRIVQRPLSSESCADARPYDHDQVLESLRGQYADPPVTRCTSPHLGASNTTEARRITVSGGLFGCNVLVADTLPGRLAGTPSEMTVFAGETGTHYEKGEPCAADELLCPGFSSTDDADVIRAGWPPIELKTEHCTKLHITSGGDVIRKRSAYNDEHIIVTPFRDDSDNAAVSALRIVNDGTAPGSTISTSSQPQQPDDNVVSATADVLSIDPRLDVLALNRAVLDADGYLVEPIQFAIYTNYSKFIKDYKIEVLGSSADGYARTPLYTETFTEYRFDQPREFAGRDRDLSQYTELEYRVLASSCEGSFDERDCDVDQTSTRILNVRDDGRTLADHAATELWGQSNLAVQRIGVRGGRVRFSGKEPNDSHVQFNGTYVPVSERGTWVLEEHLPAGDYLFSPGSEARRSGDVISADATKIKVSGGLFGCGKVEIDLLEGRVGNGVGTTRTATVVADLKGGVHGTQSCRSKASSDACPIEITSAQGSRICVTQSGDVLSRDPVDDHPPPHMNLQQLVVMPFRDYTDNSQVTALRITNEGSPRELPAPPPGDVINVTVKEDYWFTVALASLTVGQNNLSGNPSLLSADEHFDGSTFTDGRLAFYTRGKVDNKYFITAQLDSTEDELRNFSDNLKRKDPRRIFRQLDPNRYYPTYGDDSTTTTDVDTQGAFYARVDWDKNTALWGNYNTGLTDTEFTQYNRSLYGAKFEHENLGATKFGDAKTSVKVFGSEAQSVAAHVTFRATGGSLYYLRDTDIVQGSEKVWVEVRRRDTEQVTEQAVMLEGRDYEIDAIQGRIILRRPLSQVVSDRSLSIIRSSPLEGDEVFLLVDYEFVPATFAAGEVTYGGRGQAWLGNHVAIGATGVTDERDGADYTMQGADLMLKLNERSYLRAEYAQSRARQNNANFISSDGGLTFQTQTSGGLGDSLDGDATAIELRADLANFSRVFDGDFHAWWKTRDAEFSTGRLGQGFDVNDSGVELHANMGSQFKVVASHTDLEREQHSRERVTRVQIEGRLGEVDAGVEVRHEDVEIQALGMGAPLSVLNGTTRDGEALLVGARLGYDLSGETSVYAAGQTVADDRGDYQENDLLTLGVKTRLNEEVAVSLEASDGDRGSALIGGIDYAVGNGLNFQASGGVGSGAISQFATRYAIGEGHELYGSYAVDPDRTDIARNLLTLGQRRAFGNGIDLFAESQFGKDDQFASTGHVFGLEFEGKDDWRFNASMQLSENANLARAFERRAMSFGAYRNRGDFKLASRIEYREDEGADIHSRQYVTSNSFTRTVDDSNRWLGQLNLSWTDDELNGGRDARFVELDIAYAYRPTDNDKLNLISRYGFLYDLPTEGQASLRPDERSHLLSVEGIYDLQNRWELAAKLAIREGERRILRGAGPWEDFGLRMISARARYDVTHKWDALVEYRWLSDIDGDNYRHGALLALYRQVNDHMKVGVGFNFTDFNDELRIDSYENSGWFLDIVGMY